MSKHFASANQVVPCTDDTLLRKAGERVSAMSDDEFLAAMGACEGHPLAAAPQAEQQAAKAATRERMESAFGTRGLVELYSTLCKDGKEMVWLSFVHGFLAAQQAEREPGGIPARSLPPDALVVPAKQAEREPLSREQAILHRLTESLQRQDAMRIGLELIALGEAPDAVACAVEALVSGGMWDPDEAQVARELQAEHADAFSEGPTPEQIRDEHLSQKSTLESMAVAVVNAARTAMDESFEVGNEHLDIGVPAHLATALSLRLDEYDRAGGESFEREQVPESDVSAQRAEVVAAWNDLPASIRCHPGLKRLFRACQVA